jgi:hypothetical protein
MNLKIAMVLVLCAEKALTNPWRNPFEKEEGRTDKANSINPVFRMERKLLSVNQKEASQGFLKAGLSAAVGSLVSSVSALFSAGTNLLAVSEGFSPSSECSGQC